MTDVCKLCMRSSSYGRVSEAQWRCCVNQKKYIVYTLPLPTFIKASVMSLYCRLGKMKETGKHSDFISGSAAAGVNVKQMGFSTLIILTS